MEIECARVSGLWQKGKWWAWGGWDACGRPQAGVLVGEVLNESFSGGRAGWKKEGKLKH
jgi:hypothetical protein